MSECLVLKELTQCLETIKRHLEEKSLCQWLITGGNRYAEIKTAGRFRGVPGKLPAVSVYRNRSFISEAYVILKSVYCKGIFEINGKRIVTAYSVGCKRKC